MKRIISKRTRGASMAFALAIIVTLSATGCQQRNIDRSGGQQPGQTATPGAADDTSRSGSSGVFGGSGSGSGSDTSSNGGGMGRSGSNGS